jgi:flagellar hook-basal body complex protein FliE
MNKEQFKKSISEMINFYIGQVVGFNLSAKEAHDEKNEALFEMIQTQAQGAGYTFEQGLNKLIDQVFPEEAEAEETEEEAVAEDINDMVE